jgi:inorganic phosphate transporter, PiT family
VTGNSILLTLVVTAALAFDFTNGFHDTGNAMATSIATGALRPKVAVLISGVLKPGRRVRVHPSRSNHLQRHSQ